MIKKAFLAFMLFGVILLPSCKSSQKLTADVKSEANVGNKSVDVLKFTLEYNGNFDIVDTRNLTFTRKYRLAPIRRKFFDFLKKKKTYYSFGTIMLPSKSVPIQFAKLESDTINTYYYSARLDTLPDNVNLQVLSDNYEFDVYFEGRTQRFSSSSSVDNGHINADVNNNVKRLLEYVIRIVSRQKAVKSLKENEVYMI